MKNLYLMTTKFFPKKSLGQNFLINPRIVEKIIKAGEISSGDIILEVGPGKGILTRGLMETGAKIIAIEKDRRIIEDLKNDFPKTEIIEADVLKFNPKDYGLKEWGYKIVANLPYYITSHFLRTVFEKWPRPSLMVLMVQREV